ncbi:MAG TPA: lamin tail domain-containing protein, partial [Methylomirabilota bacterium]|nr:lamin tail domain-containing protein [Methylomirabilota bacterium]
WVSRGVFGACSMPTPGAVNSGASTVGPATALRLNEWMAQPGDGPDWFEIFNSTNLPVDMTGLVLTDDPTTSGTNEFRVAPLSFIGANSFVQWLADSQSDQGRNHVNFDLNSLGEAIRLYAVNGSTAIDTVVFGAQALGVSQGRVPDGVTNTVSFPGSPTPGESNFKLIGYVEINEILTHTNNPADMIELRNLSDSAASIGGWFLSDSVTALKKFRIPDGASISPHGFVTFPEAHFNSGANAFALDRARGGELWLSAADLSGNLTGARTRVKFGAAASTVSFGRYQVGAETDFVAQSARTFGGANAGPLIGPVVIHEMMYHPMDGLAGATEFIELRNITGLAVPLFDQVRPTNGWRLQNGIDFTFPQGATLGADGYLIVVDFDPSDVLALAAFRARYSVQPTTPVFGPYAGKLDNGGESIELLMPDLPDGAFVPYVLVDKVSYRDASPWPSGSVDGGGLSLQRRVASAYGNDAANWLGGPPTPGIANTGGFMPPPVVVQSPPDTNALVGAPLLLEASATGSGPLNWQWRFNGVNLPDATNSSFAVNYLLLDDSGLYDVFVQNPGGVAFSSPARVTVVEAPSILSAPPATIITNGGSNYTFSVSLAGTEPMLKQWLFNETPIAGANGPSLALTNLVITQSGDYTFTGSNAYGTTTGTFRLLVGVRPTFTNQPQAQTVLRGGTAAFSVLAGPNHPLVPLAYRWIRAGSPFLTSSVPYLVLTDVQTSVSIRCAVTNLSTGLGGVNSSTVQLTVLADHDQDGMGDAWEVQYGLNTNSTADASVDLDGDGMINREEYVAGTNPNDPLSLLNLSLTAWYGGLLEFVTQPNVSYRVEYQTNLTSAPWNLLLDVPPQSLVRTTQVNAPFSHTPGRFYRVVIPVPAVP